MTKELLAQFIHGELIKEASYWSGTWYEGDFDIEKLAEKIMKVMD